MAFRIVNLVATTDVGQPIKLEKLVEIDGGSFVPEAYPCAYLAAAPMAGKAIIFSSGKLIGVGTRSLGQARQDLELAVSALSRARIIHWRAIIVRIRNVVGTADLGRHFPLEKLAQALPQAEYSPEVFPGLILRPVGSRFTVLLFSSGKVIATTRRTTDFAEVGSYLNREIKSLT